MGIDPTAELHPTAIVEPGAGIGPGCRIGPYCVVGPEVVLGPRVVLHSHVAVAGRTRIGEDTQIFPFASIGHIPQDLKFHGEPVELLIGARNRIREHVTMNPGTEAGGSVTRVGDDNLFMVATHVAHDCIIGSHVIMANNATLGGHVVIEDNVILGGLSAVHQFVRLGRGAMIGGMAGVVADVIPYGSVVGERAHLAGLNLVGLKRRGAGRADIHGLRAAYGEMFGSEGAAEGSLQERVRRVAGKHAGNPLVEEVAAFVTSESARSFTMPAD
ncbi:acyl-ACP--UDP-N-acetylglucosamine O-acyltransferase [Amaricoccus sp.]|uniref:acyl-ACP--UDP-N-acetylglucosamine O-acyltransferase n=1 Tax=Amaricoccus sp. TaxID=1872485 RepID=UPI002636E697|nr:acyl-ACP--UDP-N-acetylglucosamine O-acyltransferase [Amaricoccus sp.]HRO10341.1 acyl-ACP--UDP-N-acetylglucosamine O-acyltransferase [Amaricoccus sp.]